MEINENQWKSVKILDLELEQAATTVRRRRLMTKRNAWQAHSVPGSC